MPFWKCYYHVVWTTKYRQPRITPPMETVIHEAIQKKCRQLGCELLAMNGTADHIHVALSIPPTQNAAYIVGQIKGAASREVNRTFQDDERFEWQEGYGLLTFGEKVMPKVIEYIAEQKSRHQNNSTHQYMERFDE